MRRRTLLKWLASMAAVLRLERLQLWAQPRELSDGDVATLHEIAPTVLPSSLGLARIRDLVDRFATRTRDYREGVALAHGYGHPRLQKSGPSPVARYSSQLAALQSAAKARGADWTALDLEARRAILDVSIADAGIRGLPSRPMGQHVVVDLIAFYFRSSEANDDCYRAQIGRETCRPLVVTTRRPAAKV